MNTFLSSNLLAISCQSSYPNNIATVNGIEWTLMTIAHIRFYSNSLLHCLFVFMTYCTWQSINFSVVLLHICGEPSENIAILSVTFDSQFIQTNRLPRGRCCSIYLYYLHMIMIGIIVCKKFTCAFLWRGNIQARNSLGLTNTEAVIFAYHLLEYS